MRPCCPLCGAVLREHESGCGACPLSKGCEMLCCARCGYKTVAARSVVVDFFRHLLRIEEHDDGSSRIH
jgi:hypothetical protein